MAHYRSMYNNDYIGAWDLPRDATVTIRKVEAKNLTSQRGKDKKPVIYFEGREKGFVVNKTNAKAIAGMYGVDTDAWVGKRITLYATTTSAGGETVACIRVKPSVPSGKGQDLPPEPKEPEDRAPGQEG